MKFILIALFFSSVSPFATFDKEVVDQDVTAALSEHFTKLLNGRFASFKPDCFNNFNVLISTLVAEMTAIIYSRTIDAEQRCLSANNQFKGKFLASMDDARSAVNARLSDVALSLNDLRFLPQTINAMSAEIDRKFNEITSGVQTQLSNDKRVHARNGANTAKHIRRLTRTLDTRMTKLDTAMADNHAAVSDLVKKYGWNDETKNYMESLQSKVMDNARSLASYTDDLVRSASWDMLSSIHELDDQHQHSRSLLKEHVSNVYPFMVRLHDVALYTNFLTTESANKLHFMQAYGVDLSVKSLRSIASAVDKAIQSNGCYASMCQDLEKIKSTLSHVGQDVLEISHDMGRLVDRQKEASASLDNLTSEFVMLRDTSFRIQENVALIANGTESISKKLDDVSDVIEQRLPPVVDFNELFTGLKTFLDTTDKGEVISHMSGVLTDMRETLISRVTSKLDNLTSFVTGSNLDLFKSVTRLLDAAQEESSVKHPILMSRISELMDVVRGSVDAAYSLDASPRGRFDFTSIVDQIHTKAGTGIAILESLPIIDEMVTVISGDSLSKRVLRNDEVLMRGLHRLYNDTLTSVHTSSAMLQFLLHELQNDVRVLKPEILETMHANVGELMDVVRRGSDHINVTLSNSLAQLFKTHDDATSQLLRTIKNFHTESVRKFDVTVRTVREKSAMILKTIRRNRMKTEFDIIAMSRDVKALVAAVNDVSTVYKDRHDVLMRDSSDLRDSLAKQFDLVKINQNDRLLTMRHELLTASSEAFDDMNTTLHEISSGLYAKLSSKLDVDLASLGSSVHQVMKDNLNLVLQNLDGTANRFSLLVGDFAKDLRFDVTGTEKRIIDVIRNLGNDIAIDMRLLNGTMRDHMYLQDSELKTLRDVSAEEYDSIVKKFSMLSSLLVDLRLELTKDLGNLYGHVSQSVHQLGVNLEATLANSTKGIKSDIESARVSLLVSQAYHNNETDRVMRDLHQELDTILASMQGFVISNSNDVGNRLSSMISDAMEKTERNAARTVSLHDFSIEFMKTESNLTVARISELLHNLSDALRLGDEAVLHVTLAQLEKIGTNVAGYAARVDGVYSFLNSSMRDLANYVRSAALGIDTSVMNQLKRYRDDLYRHSDLLLSGVLKAFSFESARIIDVLREMNTTTGVSNAERFSKLSNKLSIIHSEVYNLTSALSSHNALTVSAVNQTTALISSDLRRILVGLGEVYDFVSELNSTIVAGVLTEISLATKSINDRVRMEFESMAVVSREMVRELVALKAAFIERTEGVQLATHTSERTVASAFENQLEQFASISQKLNSLNRNMSDMYYALSVTDPFAVSEKISVIASNFSNTVLRLQHLLESKHGVQRALLEAVNTRLQLLDDNAALRMERLSSDVVVLQSKLASETAHVADSVVEGFRSTHETLTRLRRDLNYTLNSTKPELGLISYLKAFNDSLNAYFEDLSYVVTYQNKTLHTDCGIFSVVVSPCECSSLRPQNLVLPGVEWIKSYFNPPTSVDSDEFSLFHPISSIHKIFETIRDEFVMLKDEIISLVGHLTYVLSGQIFKDAYELFQNLLRWSLINLIDMTTVALITLMFMPSLFIARYDWVPILVMYVVITLVAHIISIILNKNFLATQIYDNDTPTEYA